MRAHASSVESAPRASRPSTAPSGSNGSNRANPHHEAAGTHGQHAALQSIELFSGCGGFALGVARAGFEHRLLAEWNDHAAATLAHNKARGVQHALDWTVLHGDVRDVDWSTHAGPQDVDLVAGGPPCQPFSVGGRAKGSDDARDMWPEAIRAVRELAPRAFMFENVKGLARPAFAEYLAWITASLARPNCARKSSESQEAHRARLLKSRSPLAYDVGVFQVNAADFGAAQKRHRVVVAGVRKERGGTAEPLAAPSPTHSRDRLLWDQWITGDYWARHGLRRPETGPSNAQDIARVDAMRSAGVAPKEKPWITVRDALVGLGEPNGENHHVLQLGAKAYAGHTGSVLDEPAKALKAGAHGVPGGENMLVRDDGSCRYFSVREAARLQGLPDDWAFVAPWSECMRQLGNAVPTPLAEALGRWMRAALDKAE